MAGLVKNRTSQYKRIPEQQGENAAQASTIYQGFYGEMPMPSTTYVTSATLLKSTDVVPSMPTLRSNASVVDRHDRMKGYQATGGRQNHKTPTPPMYESPYSSKFQEWLMGPHVNFIQNLQLYRAGFPSALFPGRVPLYLSTRVDQLVTRYTGGPGPAAMTPYPRFNKAQKIPRFSTAPRHYPTQSAPG